MFKKRVIRKPPQQRCKDNEEDDDDKVEEDEESVRKQLELTKKRRKLLETMQYRHGVDASDLLTASSASTDTGKKRNKDRIIQTTTAANNVEGQSVWDQKHAAAMEEFVRNKLQTSVNDDVSIIHNNHHNEEETTKPSTLTTKTDLYKELAQQLLQSTSTTTTTTESTTRDKISDTASTIPVAAATSKDVLRAGAATALSEVILPVQDRIETMTQTQQAMHLPKNRSSSSSKGILPTSTSSTNIPAAAAAASAVSFPHRFQSTKQRTDISAVQSNPNDSKEENKHDDDRVGFQAVLMRSQQPSGSHRVSSNPSSASQKPQRASDDRVYKDFIKRQHQQRK
jgi:hypothetical protein